MKTASDIKSPKEKANILRLAAIAPRSDLMLAIILFKSWAGGSGMAEVRLFISPGCILIFFLYYYLYGRKCVLGAFSSAI